MEAMEGEYLAALRERHRCNRDGKKASLQIVDVVIVRAEEKNRGKWPLGVVEELFTGRDGVVHAAKLRTGKGHLERAVQQLYALELKCDKVQDSPESVTLNADATPFRPKRAAAVAANQRIREVFEDNCCD